MAHAGHDRIPEKLKIGSKADESADQTVPASILCIPSDRNGDILTDNDLASFLAMGAGPHGCFSDRERA
jgi:hypothetical protein